MLKLFLIIIGKGLQLRKTIYSKVPLLVNLVKSPVHCDTTSRDYRFLESWYPILKKASENYRGLQKFIHPLY